ncbi:MAG: FG-GAP repeat domain-containing protein [Burkholderiaceae bacterium]
MPPPRAGWTVVGTGDFDGDGITDLLFHNVSKNQSAIWFMNGDSPRPDGGSTGRGLIQTPAPGLYFEAVGDFNGDGKTDIVWHNPTTGQYVIWNMPGLNIIGGGVMQKSDPAWTIKAVADFNGDHIADILWFNAETGQYEIWFMDGKLRTISTGVLLEPAAGWSVLNTGDYDGDGRADNLWVNQKEQYGIWFMNGGYVPSSESYVLSSASRLLSPTPSFPWTVVP